MKLHGGDMFNQQENAFDQPLVHDLEEEDTMEKDVEIAIPSGQPTKKVARRAKNFSQQEDTVICSAWINVSLGPITGTNQTSGSYWKRFTDYFNKYKPEGPPRTLVALKHRWKVIQKEVNKFCGFLSEIERRNESGKGEQDRDAMQMFEQLVGHSFKFVHCWHCLRNEKKWSERDTGATIGAGPSKKLSQTKPDRAEPCDVNFSFQGDSEHTPRPEGRDAAKKRRVKGSAPTSSSSACVEVLQRMTTNRGMAEARREEHHQRYIAVKEKKVQVAADMVEVERIKARTAEREVELRERAEDARIMAIDVNTLPEWQREYYISLQRKIISKSSST